MLAIVKVTRANVPVRLVQYERSAELKFLRTEGTCTLVVGLKFSSRSCFSLENIKRIIIELAVYRERDECDQR